MCGPQVTGACLPGSRDRATFQRKTNGGEERKTSSGPKETVRDNRGKPERESGRVRGPGDPRQIKESVGGALRETQKVAGAGPETRLDAGGSRDRPGTSGPTAVRPKATASHPKPPGAPLPPRTPLTRSAGPTVPMGRGGAPRTRPHGRGAGSARREPATAQPPTGANHYAQAAGPSCCGVRRSVRLGERDSLRRSRLPRRPLPAGGPHCTRLRQRASLPPRGGAAARVCEISH